MESVKYRKLNASPRRISYRKLINSAIPLLVFMVLAAQLTKLFYPGNHDDEHYNFELASSVNDGLNITGFGDFIVPDIIHLIHFDNAEIDFITFIFIKSALINHRPQYLYIHCNENLHGKYWEMIKNESSIIVNKLEKPTTIFGRQLSTVYNTYHASDIARLEILMKFGGIFIDNVFVVKSLNFFRKFEISVGWPDKDNLGNQIIIAHRDARFLKLWYDSYRNYQPDKLYYNAGQLPTKTILENNPSLVHREKESLGAQDLSEMLYKKNFKCSDWMEYYAINLISPYNDHKMPKTDLSNLNEENIKTFNTTFGAMARQLLFGNAKMIN